MVFTLFNQHRNIILNLLDTLITQDDQLMLDVYEFIYTIFFYKDDMILYKSLKYFREVNI